MLFAVQIKCEHEFFNLPPGGRGTAEAVEGERDRVFLQLKA